MHGAPPRGGFDNEAGTTQKTKDGKFEYVKQKPFEDRYGDDNMRRVHKQSVAACDVWTFFLTDCLCL